MLCPTNRTLVLLGRYVFSLARYDLNYDVRDRGRMLKTLVAGLSPDVLDEDAQEQGGVKLRREQVRLILFEGKAGIVEAAEHTSKVPQVMIQL